MIVKEPQEKPSAGKKIVADEKALVPDDSYEALCVKFDDRFIYGRGCRLFLRFKILGENGHQGKEIFQAFNIPRDHKFGSGSKYYRAWCLANGWRKPDPIMGMQPDIFINKVFRIKSRTVKPKHHGQELPKEFHYSVVAEILEEIDERLGAKPTALSIPES